MKAYKEEFFNELKIFKDRIREDKTLLEKAKRVYAFIYRLHSETDKYTLYWNGKSYRTNTESEDFFYCNDAVEAFKNRVLADTSTYVELVEIKKNKSLSSVIRISS